MRIEYIRLAGLQCAITITGSAFAYFVATQQAAVSAAYGGSVALVSALWLSLRLGQSERQGSGAEKCLRHAYRAAAERFVGVLILLALGFRLQLAPLWILSGFVAGQAAWLLAPVWKCRSGTKIENAK
ncbi:MAG: ATP synthase subunit I [Nitrosomonadales bacterium]|nr:ATP synthase subunit I [Nitrosomonadales bacterium]